MRQRGYKTQVKRQAIFRDGFWMIPLTRNMFTLVDEEDVAWLSQYNWCAVPSSTKSSFYSRNRLLGFMHGAILCKYGLLSDGLEPDHINRDSLDNRKKNLRAVTHVVNLQNRRPPNYSSGTLRRRWGDHPSQFRGVSWHKQKERWQVFLKVYGKSKNIGKFACEIQAAEAYNKAVTKYFGADNYRMNVVPEGHNSGTCSQCSTKRKITSLYRGVFKQNNRWRSRIMANGQDYNLGYFHTEHEAAYAYNEAALRLHGEFARLNVIEGGAE